jgi:hypothetical protein
MSEQPDTSAHPGRECSIDCAEFGCDDWTALLAALAPPDHRVEAHKHAAAAAERGKQ